ncbi:MAG: hypothetical protein HFI93_01915 [Lachnospiraceae bacterium]|nr:hypothetical protein [Lachnospiraceae bacterium]
MRIGKRIAAGFLAAALTIGTLAGCSSSLRGVKKADYPALTAAVYGTQEIKLAEVNYYLRNLQYVYEMIYGSYYGEDMWTMTSGGPKTMEASVKESTLSKIYQIYVLNEKAAEWEIALTEEDQQKVEEAVDKYLEDTSEKILDEVGLDRDGLIELYRRNALANLVWEETVKDVSTEVSDEEAAQRRITVIALNDNSEEFVAEELKEEILSALEEGKTMSEIAEEKKLAASPYTLGEGDYADSIGPAAMALKEGEYDALHVEDYGTWYVIYCDSEFDETATETKKGSIVTERKAAAFEEVYTEWKAAAQTFEVDDDVVALLTMDTAMYVPETTTAGEEETSSEAEDETEN